MVTFAAKSGRDINRLGRMPWQKTSATHYQSLIRIPANGLAIKWLVVSMTFSCVIMQMIHFFLNYKVVSFFLSEAKDLGNFWSELVVHIG